MLMSYPEAPLLGVFRLITARCDVPRSEKCAVQIDELLRKSSATVFSEAVIFIADVRPFLTRGKYSGTKLPSILAALKMDDKKRLMMSVLHHLRGELNSGQLDSEQAEGLEVAIQCLESIYGVHNGLQVEPPLLEIYQSYLVTSIVNKPDASDDDKVEAETLKTDGNTAMNNGNFNEAIELYTKAIRLDPKNAVYYCNRAAAHSKLRNHQQAIVDCKIAIEIDPSYSKAYGRLGLAYCGLDDYANALTHYKRALDLEPANEGYKKNYDLALMKVKEMRQETPNRAAPAPNNSAGPPPANAGGPNSVGPMPNMPFNPMDMSSLFTDPQFINVASHMLTDPQLQILMSTFMNDTAANSQANTETPSSGGGPQTPSSGGGGGSGGGINDLLRMGQRLAQRMYQENPEFIEELRNTFNSSERNPNDQQGNPPADKKNQ
ncbi:Hypothetical proteinall glutamine-rich tetratricopeptide [Nesidiocoris tenuis]|uniref:SGTA homodimerisation domain-containing protein n=1 Tax=Nesidiocoris tenuis TaxID=355587 RepID=A0ABN7AC35_9HEMI|nr:Hypothetical proteinall glutamine-rich tetratricopeptide [Nesidiocoris tenuis]